MAKAIPCGYGHKIIDGNDVIYTSQSAVNYDITALSKQLSITVKMLSQLLAIPEEDVSEDIYRMAGCDIMHEAFKAVLKQQGTDDYIPTLTETAFKYTVKNLEELNNEVNKEH